MRLVRKVAENQSADCRHANDQADEDDGFAGAQHTADDQHIRQTQGRSTVCGYFLYMV
jgi:hypothetical protein